MMYRTHLAAAFLFAFAAWKLLAPENVFVFFGAALFASLLPDVDSERSFLGGFSFLGHRGFFHSLFVPAAVLFFGGAYAVSFSAGYFSHIFADMLTVRGVMPVYPFSEVRFRGFIKTGGVAESFIFSVLVALDFLICIFQNIFL